MGTPGRGEGEGALLRRQVDEGHAVGGLGQLAVPLADRRVLDQLRRDGLLLDPVGVGLALGGRDLLLGVDPGCSSCCWETALATMASVYALSKAMLVRNTSSTVMPYG